MMEEKPEFWLSLLLGAAVGMLFLTCLRGCCV